MGYKTFEEYVKEQQKAGGNTSGHSGYVKFEDYVKTKTKEHLPADPRERAYLASGMDALRRDIYAYAGNIEKYIKNKAVSGSPEQTEDFLAQSRKWRGDIFKQQRYFQRYASYFSPKEREAFQKELEAYQQAVAFYQSELTAGMGGVMRQEQLAQRPTSTAPKYSAVPEGDFALGNAEYWKEPQNPFASVQNAQAEKTGELYREKMGFLGDFYSGKAPVTNLTKSNEDTRNQIASIDQQIADIDKQIEELTYIIDTMKGMNPGATVFDEKLALQDPKRQAQLQEAEAKLQGLLSAKVSLESERKWRADALSKGEEEEGLYWALALGEEGKDPYWKEQDPEAEEKVKTGKRKYEADYAKWENAVKGSSEVTGMKKENLTFSNEEEYQKWLENEFAFLGTDSQVYGKKANEDGSVEVTVATMDYSMDVQGAQIREREGLPIALSIDHLDEKEKEIFYYLVGAGYEDMAASYVQQMALESRKEKIKKYEDWAGKNWWTKILATHGYGALLPAAGYDFFSAGGNYAKTGLTANPKLGPGAIRDAFAGGVSKSLNNWSGTLPEKLPVIGGKGLGDAYQMGLSMGDSYGSAMAFGGYATLFLGLSGASSAYNNAIMKGASVEQAQTIGAVSGIAEALFEYVSIGKFLDGKTTGKVIADALIQGGVEASEEALTSITNRISDNVVMKHLSDRELAIEEYMKKQGMSRAEAEKMADKDFYNSLAYDIFAGFVTGGTMGGAQGIKNKISETGFVSAVMKDKNSDEYKIAARSAGVTAEDNAKLAEQKLRQWYRDGKPVAVNAVLERLAEKYQGQAEQEGQGEKDQLPDWEQYELENADKRFVREVRDDVVDQLEDFRLDRDNLYFDAQDFSDTEMQQATQKWEAIRNDESKDGKSREQAQYMLDALDMAQQAINRAAEQEMLQQEITEGGTINGSNPEILDDSGKRDEGLGAGGQAGSVAESTGRPVSRGERAKQKAVFADLKENGRAQSAKEIGALNGSEEQSLYVLRQSDIDQSAQWKRIQEDAEADGARAILFAGDLKVYNPTTQKYFKAEGMHKVDENGSVTYYIKADSNLRDAEQIYRHEEFHEIVSNNPELLGDLVIALELEYDRQEIVRLVMEHIEAYKGIYGTFEEGMSKKEEDKLTMQYMEEVFADVYADIQRGKIGTASARKIMRDQTDAVQRAAQNQSGIKNKKAPPKQRNFDKSSQKYSVTQEMTEKERYEELKDKSVVAVNAGRYDAYKEELHSLEQLEAKAKSKAEKIIYPLAEKLGILNKTMKTPEVDIEFLFSKNKGLKESLSKQLRYGGSYADFAKALVNIDSVLENALLIEMHHDKYAGTSRANEKLEMVYVLLGALRDGEFVIPVQFEIKKLSDTANRLYLAVSLTKIEAGVLGSTPDKSQARFLIPASITYRIADVFQKINPSDKHFLKYIPNDFLTERQLQAKKEAIAEDVKRIAKYADEKYIAAVEQGDMETAQRMVDKAAEKAGYTIHAYHGTPNGTYNVFKGWQYFTESKEYADVYQNQGASSNGYKKTALKPKTYEVFLKTEKPFDTRQKAERNIFQKEFFRQWGNGAPLSEKGLPDWTDGDDLIEFFEENEYDYDAIYLDEGGTGGYGDAVKDRGMSIVIKSSEQIKSADPVTYDDEGKVIPLSERFNFEKVDIRYSVEEDAAELDVEYDRKMAEDEEPRRGKTEPSWDSVHRSLNDYNAAAKAEKESRAEKSTISTLKNRIEKNEQLLRRLSDMRSMAKQSNFLSRNMDQEIERRKAIVQETLEIDRAALKTKQEAKKQEEKTRKQKKQEKELQQMKAQQATEELVDQVLELFSTKKGERWDIREMLHEIADKIVKDGRITDKSRDKLLEVLYENSEVIAEPDGYFSDIRKYVQHTKIYVPDSVRSEFGDDWNNFRQAAFGHRIYLTNNINDMGIDSVTQELGDMFGGVVTEDADLKEQLERILELAEEGKAEKITLPEMMRRNRDSYGWSVEEQMDEMERKLDEALRIFSEKASIEISIRQKSLRDMMKQRDGFRKVLERQREAKATSALMGQVLKRAQRLKAYRKRATPSVRRMIDEQLGDLDTLARSISSKGLEDIQLIMDNYKKAAEELGEAFIANPEIEQRFERVKQTHLEDMNVDEVRELGEALTGLITQIRNYNRMVSEERQIFVTDMANQAQQEIEESDGRKNSGILQKYMQGQLNAKVFFGKISGFADGAWKRLAEKLSQGEEMARQYQMQAMAMFDSFLSDKANQQWLKNAAGKSAVWEKVSVKGAQVLLSRGLMQTLDSIELTPMMKVSLLMHSKNRDNLQHIGYFEKNGDVYELKGGGVTIPDKALYKKGKMQEAYAQGTVLRIPPDAVRAIAKSCTEQEKTFAALLTKYFDGMAKSAVNEVSLAVDGWERATVQNYFPIQSDKAFVVTENELVKQDLSLQGSSFLKERSHRGTNPMYLFDATDVLFRNIEQVSKYYGLTRPLRDLQAVMNATYYKSSKNLSETTAENELLRRVKEQEGWGKVNFGSVEKTLLDKWGTDAKDYIEKLSKDLQGDKTKGNVMGEFLSMLRGNYARAVISFNPSSVAKQLSSYPVALAYLNVDDLAAGLATKYFKNAKEAVMNLSRYSAVYWYRNQGNVNTELKEFMERKGLGASLPLGYKWTQMMDSAVTRRLLAACMHHVSKNMGLQPGSQESVDAGTDRYWSEVAKLFNKVVLDTQSNTSTMERADIARGDRNSIEKFITMFRTDAFQQHNLQVEARGMLKAAKKAYDANPTEANKKRLKDAKKHWLKTTAGVLTGQIMVGAITSALAVATFRDKDFYDEEGKFDWEKFLSDIGLNIVEGYAGLILGLDWIWSLAESQMTDKTWYGPEVVGLESLKTFGEDVSNFIKAVTELDFREGKKQFRKLAKSAGMVFGIPTSNIEKYLMAACRWIAPEFAERWDSIWDDTAKDDLKNRSPRVEDEAIGVILDNRTDDLSDEDKTEIARLYMAGGTGAVPSGIPTSFSYNTEDGETVVVTMSAKDKETYRELWSETVSSELHKLLSSEQYESADDEKKTEYIDKLYKFADQMAKNAIDPGKELDKWVQQGLDAQKSGVALGEYVAFRVDLSDIDGTDESVDGLKMQRCIELLEAMGWTDAQEKDIWLDVIADNDASVQGKEKEIKKLMAEGMSREDAEIAAGMTKEEEVDALSAAGLSWDEINDIVVIPKSKTKQRWTAIANMNISEKAKVDAMKIYANTKTKNLLQAALEYGVKMEWYMDVKNNADSNGNGSLSQDEVTEYIKGMDLSWQEKTYLWQAITDGKEGNSNPFLSGLAYMFWQDAHKNDPPEEDDK